MQLLDFLMARGRLDAVQRDRVLALRRQRGESESVIATRLGMIDERDMAECLAQFLGVPLAAPDDYPAARCGPAGLTPEFLTRAYALPLRETDDGLVLAMADPTDDYTLKAVRLAARGAVLPWVAVPSELKAALARIYDDSPTGRVTAASNGASRDDVRRLADLASEEPAIRY